MKVIVFFSGGKDSHASLIWAVKKYGIKNTIAVFCDTQWEHALLYPFIDEVCEKINVPLVKLQSQYSFLELALKKNRFPSTKARFCTEELKVKPAIDYILKTLEITDYIIVIQGIRKDESISRSKMKEHCQYFKYYFTPYGHDKNGKPKTFSYRKKDIVRLGGLEKVDIERPMFERNAGYVIDYILQAGHKPNPLYYTGAGRVGCYPCIMVTHYELWVLIDKSPDYAERIINAERTTKRSFFPPDYIPKRYNDLKDANGKTFSSAERVFEYIRLKHIQGDLFPDVNKDRNCMTAFNICE